MAAIGAKGCRARPRLSVALEWTFVPSAGAARPSYTKPLKLELSLGLERQRLDVAGGPPAPVSAGRRTRRRSGPSPLA